MIMAVTWDEKKKTYTNNQTNKQTYNQTYKLWTMIKLKRVSLIWGNHSTYHSIVHKINEKNTLQKAHSSQARDTNTHIIRI